VPPADEAAAVRELFVQGWAVGPGERVDAALGGVPADTYTG
jgi:hypothetical protein